MAVYCTICDRGVLVFAQIQVFSRHLGRFDGKKRPRCITGAGKSISEVLREAVRNGTIEKSAYTEYLRSRKKLTQSERQEVKQSRGMRR